ncbi:phosphatidylserine/phosphatidylglycerophosphate/cardiolipin synthase family protein [Neisseria sp. DTU_2021_1001991_1_SI_NGA_ILE_055]|uniref:phospholipase D-like domain-containing protein n=1 Tax=Neisseria sp. DTU_2021_1001991_1_SI_NGA_ILE_055 TaxID=3077590 RepID=UPI0028E5B5D2|nr:phosphatidylserine/phosphatidylglycerophosphate/cardiolipin synthase family protein [Neisseria sp. DTU_2021_1001991_1_SI_NGA_ILE_055]WNS84102.1 phosphatidylserine/phosphatidylglycerophosphate/cardiolipin synthase family protein [Neisseria sp. DTU_2021_1001991_1_SI_NGA_ILE_055]
MGKPVIATSTKSKLGATVSMNWFLDSKESSPVAATFRPLINGKEAFTTLHEKIEKAEHSIDIAIWGFQPSMHLKRDGKSKCIGDLLIEKAKAGVQVRILVWSIPFKIQTFSEANMGNAPGVFSGGVAGVTKAQKQYDRNWYLAREGKLHTLDPHASQNIQKSYPHLWELSKSSYQNNLKFKTRSVESQSNQYEDKELPENAKATLRLFPSHHQKTVLIDYEVPHKAVGFVMEHNMLDNYWDDNSHISGKVSAPNQGKNVDTPLQDVSSIVSGEVLWYINRNFCQSWDKVSSEKLGEKRKALTFDKYPFNKSAGGTPLMAQILRTYDKPDIEDIKKIYLQNIKRVTSYIYTENQYFRWPPLAEAFIKHWQNLRSKGRPANMPIHWFVVTNSSDDGLGKGTYTTNKMLEKLGRQDVMPNVALTHTDRIEFLEASLGNNHAQGQGSASTIAKWKRELAELKESQKQRSGTKERSYTKNAEEVREKEFVKKLKKELGVKVHVCTLTASNAWKEVYIHSKVTIIDDVFTVISSANLNTRSMQVDTELGIFTENGAVARKLRKDLWKLHTRDLHKANNAAGKFDNVANPDAMNDPNIAKIAFERWEKIMQINKANIKGGKPPLHPLCEFLRLDPKISQLD